MQGAKGNDNQFVTEKLFILKVVLKKQGHYKCLKVNILNHQTFSNHSNSL